MKKALLLTMLTLSLSGCNNRSASVWDDKHASNGFQERRSLWGNEAIAGWMEPADEEFIPLDESDLKMQYVDAAIPQPAATPGMPGSGVPSIDLFKNPSEKIAHIFRNLHFRFDDYALRNQDDLQSCDRIATYLKKHPKTYIFVEGHCDERGPEQYNLSLGSRRANSVRTALVKRGVNPNQIYTVSYGKEHPLAMGHNPDAWKENRRAQFKIFEK